MRSARSELAVDAGLAAATAALVLVAIRVADEPDARTLDPRAYLLGVLIAAPILVRRRWPLGALVVAAVALLGYYATGYPGFSPALPLAVLLYTATGAGRLRWALSIAGTFVVGGLFVLIVRKHQPVLGELTSMAQVAGLLVAVIMLGEAVRSRRRRAEEEASRLVAEERLRIARELHDVLAHTISVITVQAGVASEVLTDSPAEAKEALGSIRDASRQAVGELRATLDVLRDGTAPRAPTPGLDRLADLLAAARGSGLRVETSVRGDPVPLPPAVDLTAYRIVQESLTNVVRHAGARTATVSLDYATGRLAVCVEDDGPAASAFPAAPGHGIHGMIERATALGGTLHSGPRVGGGYRVAASLPTEEPT